MRKSREPTFNRDVVRFLCFLASILAATLLFLGTPALTLPTLCSVALVTLLSPWITTVERRGFSRHVSILIVLGGIATVAVLGGWLIAKNWQTEWLDVQENAPAYFSKFVQKLSGLEARLKANHPLFKDINIADQLSNRGNHFGNWIADKGSSLLGEIAGCLFLVPILTFCLLSEGRAIRRKLFQLVPNRFFESVYIVTHGVVSALSDYLRAKMIEAFLVGAMTTIGLAMIGSPYAVVLGLWAGVTNIIPYIGPILGAVPGILFATMGSGGHGLIWETVTIYAIANLIDTLVIFPGIVAKLVNLNPLLLIASVVIGQYYYGIIGMLISIPIAAAIKVVLYEFYLIIYGYSADLE
jgi:putative permease